MSQFAGRVALITGGSAGIGRAAAIAFAKQGANVVVASRRQAESEETLKLVKQAGAKGIFVKTDVAKAKEVEALVAKTVSEFGRLDFAFNNAGVLEKQGLITEQDEETFDYVMNVNVRGIFLSMKYEIAQMLKNGGGAIVNMSSILGTVGTAGGAIYTASKHAVNGLTKATALGFAKQGIRINAVGPAAIETDMYNSFATTDNIKQQFASLHPIGRIGQPEEVADAVIWLCSDGASFVTGQTIYIDGGFIAQ